MKNRKTNFIMLMLSSVLCFTVCNIFGQESVKIGTQEWTTNNLNVATFKNGDAIPEVKTQEAAQAMPGPVACITAVAV